MKNPMMSLWLSAANSWAGPLRGAWTAELHRQQSAMMKEMVQQGMKFWGGAWLPAAQIPKTPKAAPVRRRKRASRS